MLRLDGDDPWLEIALDPAQSAALAGGAAVLIQCEYIPSLEYLLQENGRVLAELRESSARFATLSAALPLASGLARFEQDLANLAARLARIEERLARAEAAVETVLQSRIWRFLAASGGLLLPLTSLFRRKKNGA